MAMVLLNIKFTSFSLLLHSPYTLLISTLFADIFNISLSNFTCSIKINRSKANSSIEVWSVLMYVKIIILSRRTRYIQSVDIIMYFNTAILKSCCIITCFLLYITLWTLEAHHKTLYLKVISGSFHRILAIL